MPANDELRFSERASLLDPRTKLALLFLLPAFLLSGAGGAYFAPVRMVLSILPFALLFLSGNGRKAAEGLLIWAAADVSWRLAQPHLGPVPYILLMILHGFAVRLFPCALLGIFVLNTTTVSEFVAGLNRLHVPKLITIPLSVIFRFFPTVLEETRAINQAMRMRGIRLGGCRAGEILEYRVIPAMMCSLKIADELSAAALSRGLDSPGRRSSICPIRLRFRDYFLFLLCFAVLLLWLLSLAGVRLW